MHCSQPVCHLFIFSLISVFGGEGGWCWVVAGVLGLGEEGLCPSFWCLAGRHDWELWS